MSSAENIDHRELEARAEREADDLERRNERLGQEIEGVRRSWEGKRADPAVAGATPPDLDREAEASEWPALEARLREDASAYAAETPPEGAVGPPADT